MSMMGCDNRVDVLDNRCPACGAKIDFNPVNQKWDCKYCGSKFTLEEMKKYENASNDKANTVKQNLPKEEKLNGFDNYRCKSCGAEIMADETTTATFCVYCGSTAILKEKIDKGRAPDLIIPFKNTKEEAVKAFGKLTKNKPLMPRKFKEVTNIEKISGVYIPFWAYDIATDGDIIFSCTDVITWSDSKYHYTKTDRYETTVKSHFDYEKVLADASSRFKDELMDSIEPFVFTDLVDYNHAYLSGFLAEKYDVEEDEAFVRANDRTMNTCIDLASGECKHMSKSVKNNNLKLKKTNTYHIMLPVWMVNIKYNEKIYTFAMNGQTGKMVGDIPIGRKETFIWTVIVFIILLIVGYLFSLLIW